MSSVALLFNKVVSRDYTGLIRGKKTFMKSVNVLGHLDAASINGVDLREFASQVFTKTDDQVINAHYTFTSSVTIGKQITTGTSALSLLGPVTFHGPLFS